jgi:hypothetical protein
LWDACVALDEFMLDKAVEKSEEWFGKPMTKEIIQEFYKPVVRASSNPDKYKPTIRFKLNPPYTEIFDDQGNRIESLDYITKGSTVRGIVELSFWMVGKNFGVSLRAVQLQVLSRPVGLSGFAFTSPRRSSEDENAASETADMVRTFFFLDRRPDDAAPTDLAMLGVGLGGCSSASSRCTSGTGSGVFWLASWHAFWGVSSQWVSCWWSLMVLTSMNRN